MGITNVKVGVVVVCRNEEEDLPGLLTTVLPWVDEVVLVDDGSTDRTVAIAAAAGPAVRVLTNPMGENRDFAKQRNIGIEAARSDWLLHMDADERVRPEMAREILDAIGSGRYDALRFRRLNFFLQRPMRGGGWQHWNQVHLARREVLRFENPVHERPILSVAPHRIGQLSVPMWHLNDASFTERLQKNVTYSQIEAERIARGRERVGVVRLLFFPLWRAFRAFFISGGYREGIRGLIHAIYTFSGTFNWYAIAWEKQNPVSRTALEDELRDAWTDAFPDAGDRSSRRGAGEPGALPASPV